MRSKLTFEADRDAKRLIMGPPGPDATDAEKSHWDRLVGQKLHAIEGNPLDAEQVALFRRFEAEGLSDQDRRDEIARRGRMRAQGQKIEGKY